jgi:hypothetical protein
MELVQMRPCVLTYSLHAICQDIKPRPRQTLILRWLIVWICMSAKSNMYTANVWLGMILGQLGVMRADALIAPLQVSLVRLCSGKDDRSSRNRASCGARAAR